MSNGQNEIEATQGALVDYERSEYGLWGEQPHSISQQRRRGPDCSGLKGIQAS